MSIFGKILSAIGLGSEQLRRRASAAAPAVPAAVAAAMAQVDVEKVVSAISRRRTKRSSTGRSRSST